VYTVHGLSASVWVPMTGRLAVGRIKGLLPMGRASHRPVETVGPPYHIKCSLAVYFSWLAQRMAFEPLVTDGLGGTINPPTSTKRHPPNQHQHQAARKGVSRV
jgi:hypothetical protein